MVDAPAPADLSRICDAALRRSVTILPDPRDAEITRLRSLLPPHAPVTPGTIAIPEDMLWSVSRHLRVLSGLLMSGEVRAEVEADRAAVFALLTEVAPV